MDWRERITVDPQILVGKPVIRGTRIAVELVIDLLLGRTKLRSSNKSLLDEVDVLSSVSGGSFTAA